MIAYADMPAASAFLGRFRPFLTLSRAEEEAAIERAKAGDRRALDRLCRAHVRFVARVASRYHGRHLDYQDLMVEGLAGLCRAARKFDPSRGVRFMSMAGWWIRQGITNALAMQDNLVRLPHNFSDLNRSGQKAVAAGEAPTRRQRAAMKAWESRGTVFLEETPDWTPGPLVDASNPLEGYEAAQEARELLGRLEPRQREALALRHGLKTGYPMNYAEMSEVMGCSRQRAQQIVKAAERRLRRRK